MQQCVVIQFYYNVIDLIYWLLIMSIWKVYACLGLLQCLCKPIKYISQWLIGPVTSLYDSVGSISCLWYSYIGLSK